MQSMLVNLVNDRFFLSVFRKDLCATFLKLYILYLPSLWYFQSALQRLKYFCHLGLELLWSGCLIVAKQFIFTEVKTE